MSRHNYRTIIDAISDLQERGYFLDFSLIGNRLFYVQQQRYLKAEEFEVREIYRFRERSYPYAEKIVFAIDSNFSSLKGILLCQQ